MVSLQVEETSKFLIHWLKGVTKAQVHSFLFSAILVRLFSSSSKIAATIAGPEAQERLSLPMVLCWGQEHISWNMHLSPTPGNASYMSWARIVSCTHF